MNLHPYHVPFDLAVFPSDYFSARSAWLSETHKIKGLVERKNFSCAASGPKGEALFTDSLWMGERDADHVLVIISGTHGIEGYAGSAVLLDFVRLLNGGFCKIPQRTALLMIHALTPWGYAWKRRCDEKGIDLNRNCVNFDNALPENPDYERIKPILKEPDKKQRLQAFQDWIGRFGRESFESAVSKGQYSDPLGPFYGGREPAHGRRVVEDLIGSYSLAEKNLAVIDIHTGLGGFGYGEIICDHPTESAGTRMARQWYGDSVALPALGTSSSVPKLGLLDYIWHNVMNECSCFVTLEFGTYPTGQLFEVLIMDHQLWADRSGPSLLVKQQAAMLRHFCPADRAWREMVLFRARQTILQALQGLEHL